MLIEHHLQYQMHVHPERIFSSWMESTEWVPGFKNPNNAWNMYLIFYKLFN